jgi:hypothetical protein
LGWRTPAHFSRTLVELPEPGADQEQFAPAVADLALRWKWSMESVLIFGGAIVVALTHWFLTARLVRKLYLASRRGPQRGPQPANDNAPTEVCMRHFGHLRALN